MKRGEVTVDNVSLLDIYGLYTGTPNDVLFPSLRERKITIPARDGRYDYGADTRDERNLGIHFVSSRDLERSEIREISYRLSKKCIIRIWDEPDKYYYGRIYDATEINRLSVARASVVLNFICDPFAYGEQVTEHFQSSSALQYAGTARTPTYITITNNNSYPLTGIILTMREATNR